jgi:hypothetical protein
MNEIDKYYDLFNNERIQIQKDKKILNNEIYSYNRFHETGPVLIA